ncbi:MAG: flavodoxin-dependent (E)-4-hydroxy-3-methylbut-2-enyl-diphosphate synthase [Clostridia bacterium]
MARIIKRVVSIGNIKIGGKNKIAIQSMTNTDTKDVEKTLDQIHRLAKAGCDLVRVSVYDYDCAVALEKIKEKAEVPIVADIHFDPRIAIESIYRGADKIRINPGNIGGEDNVAKIVQAAKQKNIPIRIGVNAGSLSKDILYRYGKASPHAMFEEMKRQVDMIEKCGYTNLVLSAKSSTPEDNIKIYEMLNEMYHYPLHIGVTEAGTLLKGSVKSSVVIGILLRNGIGDTIRVSLTDDPVYEVITAREILRTLGLHKQGIQIISCPTCARTGIDIIKISKALDEHYGESDKTLKVAVMGCVVNGPEEARNADIGVAGGDGCAVLFKKGEVIRKIKEEDIIIEMIKEIDNL